MRKASRFPNKMEREVLGLGAGRGGLGASSQRTHASQSEIETGAIKFPFKCAFGLVVHGI